MKQFKILGVALAAAMVVACGGGSDSPVVQAPAISFTSMVSFGDSLSDVGTYKVGAVALMGGGTYSVNGVTGSIPTKNWTEIIASQLGLPAPCPAQTGLNGTISPIAIVNNPTCRNYAQGGARVTDPVGPGSASAPVNSPLGQLTVPIVTQIANHLTRVGSFSGTELVTVMAGGNDVLRLLDTLVANATAAGSQAFAGSLVGQLAAGATNPATAAQAIGLALQTEAARVGHTDQTVVGAAVGAAAVQPGNSAVASPAVYGPMVVTAQAAGAAAGAAYAKTNGAAEAVFPMGEAGKQLASYIKTQIVGKGAKYVAVVNLPDVSSTPSATSQSADTQGLILNMVIYFNTLLASELAGTPGVHIVDTFTDLRSQIANPTSYGLTNVTTPACNLNATANGVIGNGLADPAKPESGTSLVCNTTNVKAGDVSKYLFADTVHPTPYSYKLLADLVNRNLTQAGWL
jgi:outer membrane lipase/esterase